MRIIFYIVPQTGAGDKSFFAKEEKGRGIGGSIDEEGESRRGREESVGPFLRFVRGAGEPWAEAVPGIRAPRGKTPAIMPPA